MQTYINNTEGKCGCHYQAAATVVVAASPAADIGVSAQTLASVVVLYVTVFQRTAITLAVVNLSSPDSATIPIPSAAYTTSTLLEFRAAFFLGVPAVTAVLSVQVSEGSVAPVAELLASSLSAVSDPSPSVTQNTLNLIKELTGTLKT